MSARTAAPPTRTDNKAAQRDARARAAAPKKAGQDEIVGQALSSPGKPLDGATRERMEARFGRSFGDVRIHADERAAASARALGAAAFTADRSIVFGANRYSPASRDGQLLLAHELAHVAHQSGARQRRPGIAPPNAWAELRADRAAETAMYGAKPGAALADMRDAGDAWAIHRQVDKISKKGKVEHTGEIGRAPGETGAPFGSVEVRTGEEIELKGGGKIPNVIALAYSGLFSPDMHWLQFVWWELIAQTPKGPVAISTTIPTTSGSKASTTDPKAPKLTVDSASTTDPFYEAAGANLRDKSSITMFDRPGGASVKPLADAVFKATTVATGVTFTQHFLTFLIQRDTAVYEVTYTASTAFTKDASGAAVGGTIGYTVGGSNQVSGLSADLKKVLDAAYPKNTVK